MVSIETERLVLRALCADDSAWLVALYAAAGGSSDDAAREVDEALDHERVHGFGHLVATRTETGERIAVVELHHAGAGIVGIEPHEVEIGWVVERAHRSQGLASEAADAACRHALTTLGIDHLVAYVRPENVASLRVIEKLGMTRRGSGRSRSGAAVEVFELRR